MKQVQEALELLSRPTAKRVALAVALLKSTLIKDDNTCTPCTFLFVKYMPEAKCEPQESRVKFKKFICAICPKCASHTFDLNAETMKGQCLSCGFKSNDYKSDKQKFNDEKK